MNKTVKIGPNNIIETKTTLLRAIIPKNKEITKLFTISPTLPHIKK